LGRKWSTVAGAEIIPFQFPSLPGAQGLPLQFVITTSEPIENLYQVSQQVLNRARANHRLFYFADSDLKIDRPQQSIVVDHDMVADLGLTQQEVASVLGAAMGGGYVNYFTIAGRSYKVIPQVLQKYRLNPHQALDLHLRTTNGTLVKLGTIAHLERQTVPESINHFQQLNSATIAGVASSQGAALAFLKKTLQEVAPTGYSVDYSGPSRQYMQGSNSFVFTFGFALVIVYLSLAALFESFRDPVVILVSVPTALFGALLVINVGATTINIYSQVGLVTLLGLISKHGILMVQFANDEQRAGKPKRVAIIEAAAVRLRPILMTTAAMVLGVLPLVIATGAGAAGRKAMGWVIFAGLSIGTMFTLFIVPAVYLLLAADHEKQRDTVDEAAMSPAAD